MAARTAAMIVTTVALLAGLATVRLAGAAGATRGENATASLDQALSRDLAAAGGSGSALVVDETTGQTLFAQRATTPRLPASVEKLFTTSTALFDFGEDYRFQTDVYGVGILKRGVFSGRLYLKGGGDPSFGDAHFNAVNYGTGASVQALLKDLRAAGVHEISGEIIGDASVFDDRGGGPDSHYRANLETEGELSGLSYDAGFTSGAETQLQPNPALWATQAFAAVAPQEGITVARGTRITTGVTPASATLLARISSPNVAELLKLTNSPSDNFFAETLDKDLGRHFGAGGTTSAGAAVVEKVIAAKLGLSERTNDGSGLSRFDRTTATTVVELLEEMESSPAFYDSLAIAGVRGTMIHEMLHTRGSHNCRGKTGTLDDVANLVGYCTAANGDRLVFAFLENSLGDSTYGHVTEDLMGEALAGYDGDGNGSPAPTLPDPDAGAFVPSIGPGSTTTPTTPTKTTPTKTTPTKTTPTDTTPTTTTPAGGGSGL